MKLTKLIINSSLILILIGLFYLEYASHIVNFALGAKSDQLSIAVVADLSGPSAFTGQSHVNGVQLFVDEFNRQGGLDGVHIKVKPFDDKNDKKLSPQVARQIAKDPSIIGVIGHNYSSASLAASDVYKQAGVPAITPSSSNPKITIDNPWYFRTVMESDLEAQLSVYYAKAILNSDKICIIYEDLPYGTDLTKAFKENMKNLGMELSCEIQFSVASESIEEDLKQIVADLKKQDEDLGVIYLATHVGEGSILVRELKEQGVNNDIFTPSSFYNHTFMTAFNKLPKEQAIPGFYTEGVYVTTPLLFDTANREAQEYLINYEERFGSKPGWHSAFSYDSAKVLLHAAQIANIDQKSESTKTIREKIRNALKSINLRDTAVEGVTGSTFFNDVGDTFKPIFVARFKRNQPISASSQLQMAPNIGDKKLLERLLKEGRLVQVKDFYLQKTHVVQCGVSVNKVEELDTDKVTSLLDFYIWFRHPKEVDPTDIEFINALDKIDLSQPVAKEEDEGLIYQLFRVKAHFRGDFVSLPDNVNRNVFGLSFYHKNMDRNRLVFVTDVLGMGLIDSETVVRKLNEGQVLPQGRKLKVYSALQYQDIAPRATLGQSSFQTGADGMVDFSRFNFAFTVGKHHVSLRRNIPINSFWLMIVATVLLLILPFITKTMDPDCGPPSFLWWTTALGLFSLLLAAELVALRYFAMDNNSFDQALIVRSFDVLWWIFPAIILVQAIEIAVWCPLERRTGNQVPSIVRLFVQIFIYLIAFFCIIAFVFDQKITSLLATSGVIAMILGLALQVNLSNIFSGLAISLERPFKIGDWVKIEGMEDAEVVEMNWRTVRLQTVCDTIYCVPNSRAAESYVLNYHYPDDHYWLFFPIYINSKFAPDHVMKVIMDALLETDEVQKHMGPIVRMDYTDIGIAYYPIFLLKGYGSRAAHKNAVSKNIWKHLHRAGMTPAVPRQEIQFIRGQVDHPERAKLPFAIIEDNPLFQSLPQETMGDLAAHTMLRFYKRGDFIFKQGDTASSMFLVAQGTVSLRVPSSDGEDQLPLAGLAPGGGVQWDHKPVDQGQRSKETERLGAGEILGASAMSSGEAYSTDAVALSDCFVLEVTRETLTPLIQGNQDFSDLFTRHSTDSSTSQAGNIAQEKPLSPEQDQPPESKGCGCDDES